MSSSTCARSILTVSRSAWMSGGEARVHAFNSIRHWRRLACAWVPARRLQSSVLSRSRVSGPSASARRASSALALRPCVTKAGGSTVKSPSNRNVGVGAASLCAPIARIACTGVPPPTGIGAPRYCFRQTEYHRFHARSEEHTSELQSLLRISYAVFCLKKKNTSNEHILGTTVNTKQQII